MEVNNLGVIGVGKLGLSFALLCASKGYNVYGSDVNEYYIDTLMNRTWKTTEPQVEQLLKECTTFHPTDYNREVVANSDIIFLFVPTPSKENGEYDHQYIEQAIESIQDMDLVGKILVIGCTTMPGYTQSLIDRLEETKGVTIVYNPEFIAQGDIINGLKKADMVLVGTHSQVAGPILSGIYANIMDVTPVPRFHIMSPTAAEITKISINCYLTMKIAYANMIGEIAINSGIEQEVDTVLTAIGDDSRIGYKCLKYGFGYGGPCLPRDMRALGIHAISAGSDNRLCYTVDMMNMDHHMFLCKYYSQLNPDINTPFIFTQLSYKKGTEMLIESQQYKLCKWLLAHGYKVVIHESDTVCGIVRKEMELYNDRITFNQDVPGVKIAI